MLRNFKAYAKLVRKLPKLFQVYPSVSSTGNCFDDSGLVEQYANSTTFIIIYQQRLLTSIEMNHQGQIY